MGSHGDRQMKNKGVVIEMEGRVDYRKAYLFIHLRISNGVVGGSGSVGGGGGGGGGGGEVYSIESHTIGLLRLMRQNGPGKTLS